MAMSDMTSGVLISCGRSVVQIAMPPWFRALEACHSVAKTVRFVFFSFCCEWPARLGPVRACFGVPNVPGPGSASFEAGLRSSVMLVTHTHTHTQINGCTCIYVHTHVQKYICIHVCIYLKICIYTHISTHTYVHAELKPRFKAEQSTWWDSTQVFVRKLVTAPFVVICDLTRRDSFDGGVLSGWTWTSRTALPL